MQEHKTIICTPAGFFNGKYQSASHNWFDTADAWWYPVSCYLPAKRWDNFYDRWRYGYVLNHEACRQHDIKKKGERLLKEGWQGHRKGSVPFVHNYKNDVTPNRANGLKSEFKHNEHCKTVYPNFKLVRAKRAFIPKCAMDWDFYDHYNRQRGWKRSKKRKQWM